MNFYIFYENMGDIKTLREKLKEKFKNIGILYFERNLDICTKECNINFVLSSKIFQKGKGIILNTAEVSNEDILKIIINFFGDYNGK